MIFACSPAKEKRRTRNRLLGTLFLIFSASPTSLTYIPDPISLSFVFASCQAVPCTQEMTACLDRNCRDASFHL
ncbi:hypothetical protein B0T09DRAFT_340403 [Sordaria sp. MPI-SDFR-AT-0083]|nr:hypothetical protein B0T09DRAFT_340403 [Sordaria sp. MPI-SDFR-AT-0083]